MSVVEAVSMQAVAVENLTGEAYRGAMRRWLHGNLPASFRSDSAAFASPTLQQSIAWEAAMYRAGLTGITWPQAYGGHGRSLREHLIANQEIGALAMPESVNSIGKELAGPIILAVGTEEQKQRFLPAILDMRNIWCQGFSEPEAGSDLAGLRTRATRDGDGWRITGQKIWTSGAYRAQRCLVLARTGPLEDRHRGLAMFAVPLDAKGVRVQTIKSIDGRESFCEVFFDEVEVAQTDAIGAPDEGWAAAIRVLEIERATNRMYRAWRFENELRHLISVCKADAALSQLVDDHHYAVRLGEVAVEIEVLKAHVETAVEALVNGDKIGARGSLAKLYWSESHQRFAALALELLQQAMLPQLAAIKVARRRFEAIYLQARAETIYAGTTEIQLGIIADRILQLSRGK
ncbi:MULTISPECIES: acyl-CoA dehydrogenase [unclassified Bradyrhizobium]|uniref:acyl-CoA dehydrogenase n=1 Tax=unclassified Bradyrhizobium TaxID=2631580 RepID=UPI0015C78C40|nr:MULTISPECIES: acyl-CoA dehydrogenase [unclassified Bradyrhizobium]MBB4256372.1 alkylation response protein AidB-like acyl-CoA dehydrogenase [Bradyrhizobium sp. CIR3A]NYG43601.1 alkylation response protein AidB-like acyl-CoA dehydrogenase [Bradyrhizobium sp. IAR9]